jgi:hypothetical protein
MTVRGAFMTAKAVIRAAPWLLKAADTKKITDIEAATAQMERALRVEGWL